MLEFGDATALRVWGHLLCLAALFLFSVLASFCLPKRSAKQAALAKSKTRALQGDVAVPSQASSGGVRKSLFGVA